MIFNTFFCKRFSDYKGKLLGYGAYLCFLFMIFSLCTVLKPYMLDPIHHFFEEIKTMKVEEELCISEPRTEYCQINGDIRVHGKFSSVYIVSDKTITMDENTSRSIRPYARKWETNAMKRVTQWSIKTIQQAPNCTKSHTIPAVIFSTSGYTGNHFHEFSDIIIPLFLTCKQFNGQVHLLITDYKPWWILKHKPFLEKLSDYETIDIDKDEKVHCFPKVIVGLKRYDNDLTVDSQKYSYSMKDFRDFLRSSYSLERVNAIEIRDTSKKSMKVKKPRLLIVSRKRTRSFTNIPQIVKMAKQLGFKVLVKDGGRNMSRFANIVNSCDVLMGVHGAGLTNILFLPENAIFIQVVPYGDVKLLATNDFGKASEDMNIRYLEYKIGLEESSLVEEYPLDDRIGKETSSIRKQDWDKQNVRVDVNRFRPILKNALELLVQ
ncbi:unnamed protein product [Lathyrus oleraceus]